MNNKSPTILSIGTALPPCTVNQKLAFSLLESYYHSELSSRSLGVMKQLFFHPSINSRSFAFESVPEISYLKNEHPDDRIQRFTKWGTQLCSQAIIQAATKADIALNDITCLIVNTCTGYICPGLSTYIIEQLGLSTKIKAFDLVGAGCGGAVPNLQLASSLATKGELVASVAVEICSATFEMEDNMSLIVSNAIFGDGAAAAIIASGTGNLHLVDSHSNFLPQYRDDVRYVYKSGRLYNTLSIGLPRIVGESVPSCITDLLTKNNLSVEQISHWALHPGGAKMIDHIQQKLGLSDKHLHFTRHILKNHGNMSSPTVLFVLKEIMQSRTAKPGDWGLLIAFGAGFSIHSYLIQWR